MNYRAALVFTFFFLCLTNLVHAQKENNNWYFGRNAGITFNNGSPVALPASTMNTNEGCVSVSDSAGNLLFYSNGITIWNRNHVPMQNGTGLMGHNSATQSVLAVPKPGSSTLYYIFTVDATEHNSLQNGLRYSILDMTLDSGLGAITNTKNVLLEGPVTEKLTAVRHDNNKDYWVLAHRWNSDAFVAYELTSAGLSNTSVISKVGSVHGGGSWNAIGQMKANREGTKIALAIEGSSKFELFDFNASTGVVSNAQAPSGQFTSVYGVEFSGDGTKVYVTVSQFNQSPNYILQFNLADPAGLNAVYPFNSGPRGNDALQIGPDNKIYSISDNNYLGVINNPDAIGAACNYNIHGVSLNGNTNIFGLPNMIITARKPKVADLGMDNTVCFGESLILGEEAIDGNSYLWQDGSLNSTFKVTKPGKYTLKVKNWYFEETFEFNVKVCAPVIPNIITPNQDNLNDAFVLQGYNSTDFELQVFNRWGNLVYKTKSYQNDWDARENSAGLYYYLLRNSETGSTFKGWLEVIK